MGYKWYKNKSIKAFTLLVLLVAVILISLYFKSSRNVAPTRGEVWPKPKRQENTKNVYQVRERNPEIISVGKQCKLLHKSINRARHDLYALLDGFHNPQERNNSKNQYENIAQLTVHLTEECESYPYLGMNETYELEVSTSSRLKASSVWGIIRGLETFTQLFYQDDDKNILINGTRITDFPTYKHRGLMLDTGRLFVPIPTILTMLDGMVMNKLNVFHWHLCDNVICLVQSEVFPNMSMYEPNAYTKHDIAVVVDYARVRGIRVVPEIDVPGHGAALQKKFPSIFLPCPFKDTSQVMNPILPETYKFLKRFLGEIYTWFPDEYIHLGGDEARPECWLHHKGPRAYMVQHMMSLVDLQTMFYEKTVEQMNPEMRQIVWHDVFDYGIKMSKEDSIVQVWSSDPENKMVKVLQAGFKVLYSSYWYLNYQPYKYDFGNYYKQDPRVSLEGQVEDSLLNNILGGEACLWTDDIHDSNGILEKWIFPKASAVAEVLWSETDGQDISAESLARMKEQTMRMAKRGVPTAPLIA